MIEGWHNNGYLILFEGQQEEAEYAQRYGIADYLPGYVLTGLWDWDDFILRDEKGGYFTVPTVPLAAEFLRPFSTKIDHSIIRADAGYAGKIKWYKQPIVLGGDPRAGENMVWVPIEAHIEMVKWWNKVYRDVKKRNPIGK